MHSEKKNQHYIPKFYLRNFSYNDNKKQIGLFNIYNHIFIPSAKLKTQGSKTFFYGEDGVIEDKLSKFEDTFAKVLKQIITTRTLPTKQTKDHFELLHFVALTDMRNPVQIENSKNMIKEIQKHILDIAPNTNLDEVFPTATHDEIVKMSLMDMKEVLLNIIDLDFKLLLNTSDKPFITSDFPVVKYNQYLQWRKWPQAKTGYGQTGLKIFIPLNAQLILVFFDSGIYKVGDRRQSVVPINKSQDVDSINILQFVNCFETIFFNEKCSEIYLRNIHLASQKYKKANVVKSEMNYIFKNEEEKKRKEKITRY